jgi:hypothetical protein
MKMDEALNNLYVEAVNKWMSETCGSCGWSCFREAEQSSIPVERLRPGETLVMRGQCREGKYANVMGDIFQDDHACPAWVGREQP